LKERDSKEMGVFCETHTGVEEWTFAFFGFSEI